MYKKLYFRAGNEAVGVWISVVSLREVPIVGGHYRVSFVLLNIFSVPLSYAWTARVRQNGSPSL